MILVPDNVLSELGSVTLMQLLQEKRKTTTATAAATKKNVRVHVKKLAAR